MKYVERWLDETPVLEFDLYLYQKVLPNIFSFTQVSKYRDFQYRLNLMKIVVIKDLHDWGMEDSPLCLFCVCEVESRPHLFWHCKYVYPIIESVFEICKEQNIDICTDMFHFIFNLVHENKYHIVNFVTVFLKQYIYRCHCLGKKLNIRSFWTELEHFHNLEFANAIVENRVSKHYKKWSPILSLTPVESTTEFV